MIEIRHTGVPTSMATANVLQYLKDMVAPN